MRVWVVDDRAEQTPDALGGQLRQLESEPAAGVRVLGVSCHQPDFVTAIGKLVPDLLDVLVIRDDAWPADASLREVLDLGIGAVVVTGAHSVDRFQELAIEYPVVFAPANGQPAGLWLALIGAAAGRRRHAFWKEQVASLQQRLKDRIMIERAKGILIEQLDVSEEDAYRRLRLLARRQQRPIRDIAQSLLDMHGLLKGEDETVPARRGDGKMDIEAAAPHCRRHHRNHENGTAPVQN